MRAEPTSPAAAAAPPRSAGESFAPALTRARAAKRPALVAEAAAIEARSSMPRSEAPRREGRPLFGLGDLARSPLDRDRRRDTVTEPGAEGVAMTTAPPPPDRFELTDADRSRIRAALGPLAVDPVAVSVAASAAGASLHMTLAPEIAIRISQAPHGVAVELRGSKLPGAVARAELRELVQAMRERGVSVASASVATGRGAAR